ncbi:hypothetical protein Ddye_008363 [Dipteronia dyeriana]|uniref:Uncharacterized protein n=1 Tax=Dipteronia dyeriana TaxID=168575 RepID=A0AAD9X9T7_9ROSI|nr:hypothetical protein Ddye_008363 [Dipteronia dyeriana]
MAKFQLKKVLCMGVAVGNLSMEEKQIFQNVQLSINFLVSLLKKNWQNVSSMAFSLTNNNNILTTNTQLLRGDPDSQSFSQSPSSTPNHHPYHHQLQTMTTTKISNPKHLPLPSSTPNTTANPAIEPHNHHQIHNISMGASLFLSSDHQTSIIVFGFDRAPTGADRKNKDAATGTD